MTNPALIVREDQGRVRVLTLDRPPSNSLNLALLDALGREIEAAKQDTEVRSLLLASTNPKYFSSGLDLDEMLSFSGAERSRLFERMIEIHRALAAFPKPTVAAIEGYAFLGGFIVALGCDWRFLAEETGKVALSEVRLGLSPGAALVRLVFALTGKPGLAKELVLKGKTLKAREAFEAGFADRLFPAEGFRDQAFREAELLTKIAPQAYAAIKKSARAALLPDEDRLWDESQKDFQRILAGQEAQEGLAAMKEKRKPKWE
jgi:enoyl-CoA hydratase